MFVRLSVLAVLGGSDAVAFLELQTEVLRGEADGGGDVRDALAGLVAQQFVGHVEAHLVDICGQGEAVGIGVEQLVEYVAVDAETLASRSRAMSR